MSLPPRSARRALVAATLTASFLAVPQAQALDRVAIGARHFFQCLGLLLSDPKVHEAECLPNNVQFTYSLDSGGGDAKAIVPPVAPPVIAAPPPPPPPPPPEEPVAEPVAEPPVVVTPPPPPPPAPDPCACGACYAQ